MNGPDNAVKKTADLEVAKSCGDRLLYRFTEAEIAKFIDGEMLDLTIRREQTSAG